MKIFISWSGDRSKAVAEALRDWLPSVIQILQPWISSEDVPKGSRWNVKIGHQLAEARVGIICLTRENITAPWVVFEAGALTKTTTIEETFVCTYLLDLEPDELIDPLAQFQATVAKKPDTLKLLRTINDELKAGKLPKDRLDKTFERWWPELEKSLDNIPKSHVGNMREKAQEFAAYEIEQTDFKRLDLRFLSNPIHVYEDTDREIEFGAVFAFALGNNPEVLITLEKYPESISCELVRIGGAEMHVLWKDREIWISDHGGEKSRENPLRSYISFKYDELETGKL